MNVIVGLDIGTSNIRVAIGEIDEDTGRIRVAGVACEKSVGLRFGNIVNIEATANAIRNAIENAEQNAGIDVHSCFTSIGGEQIQGYNTNGKVAVSTKGKFQRAVSQNDIRHVMDSATAIQMSLDREMLHVITQDYVVDGVKGIKDPINRLGVCLEASVHIITASRTTIQNLTSCLHRAGYEIDGVMLKTLASGSAVMNDDECELGSILIDLGAGTTDFLVLVGDAPVCTVSVPYGGNIVTNDIAICKGITVAEAEEIKVKHGCCWLENVPPDAKVIINGLGGRPPEEFDQSELCEIIAPRIEEIFRLVLDKIMEMTTLTQLSGNIILTGGGANMNGIVEMAESVFRTSAVRIGVPEKLGGIEEEYSGPEWATAIGLVIGNKDNVLRRESGKGRRRSSSERNGNGKKENPVAKFFRNLF